MIGVLVVALAGACSAGDTALARARPGRVAPRRLVAWTGLALLWSDDLREGSIFLVAFILPFGLLASASPGCRGAGVAARLYGAAASRTALAYAGVGLYQWATREVFWNPKLKVDNAYAPFFRVNSVFWDPSIYGRYLVVAILATLALVLLGLRERLIAAGVVAIDGALGRAAVLVLTVELRGADRRHARRCDRRCGAGAQRPRSG